MKIDSQFDINLISLNKRMVYANLRTICSQKIPKVVAINLGSHEYLLDD